MAKVERLLPSLDAALDEVFGPRPEPRTMLEERAYGGAFAPQRPMTSEGARHVEAPDPLDLNNFELLPDDVKEGVAEVLAWDTYRAETGKTHPDERAEFLKELRKKGTPTWRKYEIAIEIAEQTRNVALAAGAGALTGGPAGAAFGAARGALAYGGFLAARESMSAGERWAEKRGMMGLAGGFAGANLAVAILEVVGGGPRQKAQALNWGARHLDDLGRAAGQKFGKVDEFIAWLARNVDEGGEAADKAGDIIRGVADKGKEGKALLRAAKKAFKVAKPESLAGQMGKGAAISGAAMVPVLAAGPVMGLLASAGEGGGETVEDPMAQVGRGKAAAVDLMLDQVFNPASDPKFFQEAGNAIEYFNALQGISADIDPKLIEDLVEEYVKHSAASAGFNHSLAMFQAQKEGMNAALDEYLVRMRALHGGKDSVPVNPQAVLPTKPQLISGAAALRGVDLAVPGVNVNRVNEDVRRAVSGREDEE